MNLPSTEEENLILLDRIVAEITSSAEGRPAILLDGDRTLVASDTSRLFLERAQLDWHGIKENFRRNGYCFAAFRFHAMAHLQMEESRFDALAREVSSSVDFYPGVVAFLRAASERAALWVVSSGIPRIFRYLLDRAGLEQVAVVGGIEPRFPLVFGRAEKGHLARQIRKKSTFLIAVGDSDVDTEMLVAADQRVLVVNHRRNEDILPLLLTHGFIYQVAPLGDPHEGITRITFPDILQLLPLKG